METNLKSALDNTNLLEAEGISFRAEKIMVFQNNRFSCDLVLEKGGKEERIRVIGIWLFAEENYKRQSFSDYESFIKVKLGGVCISGENSLSVCSLEKAVVFAGRKIGYNGASLGFSTEQEIEDVIQQD